MSYQKKWWVIKLCIFDYFWVIQNKAKKLMISFKSIFCLYFYIKLI